MTKKLILDFEFLRFFDCRSVLFVYLFVVAFQQKHFIKEETSLKVNLFCHVSMYIKFNPNVKIWLPYWSTFKSGLFSSTFESGFFLRNSTAKKMTYQLGSSLVVKKFMKIRISWFLFCKSIRWENRRSQKTLKNYDNLDPC